MRKIWLVFFLFIPAFFLSGCLPKKQMAALQVNSFPVASIFIDGKHVGKTPFVDREMKPGEITLKLIPESTTSALTSWEGKLKLVGGVLSVVSREFAEQEDYTSGDILTLEPIRDKKNSSLAAVTSPDGATVELDGENRGNTPLVLERINEGEHQISFSLTGFKERILKARAINGFKLIVNSKLAKEGGLEVSPTIAPVSPTPTGKITPPKPTTTPKATPSPRPTVAITGGSVQIKGTPEGWLRVRSNPSTGTSSTEITRVNEGEKYPLVEEKSGWYKIVYEEGKEGWISSQYAQKLE